MGKRMLVASVLTCCLLVLPFASASVVSSRASSWTVKSLSEKGIERRIHRQPLHLLPGTTAFVVVVPAGAPEVVKKGLMEAVQSGWSQVVTTVGFVIAFMIMLGEKLASDNTANKVELASEIKANKVELASSIDKLASKTDLRIGELSLSMRELASETNARMRELASETNLRIGELSLSMRELAVNTNASIDKLTASIDKLSEKREVSIEKLSDEMKALRSHTNTSIAALGTETKVSMREHTCEVKDRLSELNSKTEALRSSTDARMSILEANHGNHHKKTESTNTQGADMGDRSIDVPRAKGEAERLTDTRDAQVEPDA